MPYRTVPVGEYTIMYEPGFVLRLVMPQPISSYPIGQTPPGFGHPPLVIRNPELVENNDAVLMWRGNDGGTFKIEDIGDGKAHIEYKPKVFGEPNKYTSAPIDVFTVLKNLVNTNSGGRRRNRRKTNRKRKTHHKRKTHSRR
jgi:hypothetical protein